MERRCDVRFSARHYALLGALLIGVGTQLATAQHGWVDVTTPGFVAGILIQVGTTIAAIFVGAPGDRRRWPRAFKDPDAE